jgi:glutamate/tyrosine decarboxylase-like PLP-dependent enzyme
LAGKGRDNETRESLACGRNTRPVARNTKAGYDLRREGIQVGPYKMVLYASQEIHSSIQKAVELLGLGSDALRLLPVNDRPPQPPRRL